jgi:hypothetical protein
MSSPLNEDMCFSPDDYDDNPDQEDEDGGPNHKKRKQVKRACFSCRKAHARCDEERPCRRCIRTGCESTCVDVPRKKRVLKKPAKMETIGLKRGRRRRLDESGEGCESGGESDSKNFYFDVAEDEVLEGGSVAGKTTPLSASSSSSSTSTSTSSSSLTTVKKFDFTSIAINTTEDLKLSWKDSLLDSMTFAHSDDGEAKESGAGDKEEEAEFCFDLGKSSDDERCLEEIPQEMVRELTELRSYNSTLQDMIKDVQQFNSYQRKKRRQWELSKINNGNSASTPSSGALTATAAPSDALPQWLVSDFSSLSNKLVDLSSDPTHSSSTSSSSSISSSAGSAGGAAHHGGRSGNEEGEMDYLGAWQQTMANHGAPLQLPTQLALLAGHHSMLQLPGQLTTQQAQPQQPAQQPAANNAAQSGPAPFTTSLPFTEV